MGFVGMTYLHLAGATALTAVSAKYPIVEKPYWTIVSTVLSLIAFFIVLFMAPGPLKYLVFGVYLVFLGQSLTRIAEELNQKGLLEEVIASVLGIFLAMTAVGFYAGDRMLGFGPYLLFALLGLLLGRILFFVLGITESITSDATNKAQTALSWISTILFSIFIAFDTSVLQARARLRLKRPDYVDESLGLFLDIINLFVSTEDIMG